jgi:hypothetical protein
MSLDEAYLRDHIALRQPPDLTLSNHVHHLVACDRSQRILDGAKPETGPMRFLNETLILLQYII